MHKRGRVGYDFAIRQAGGKLVEIGNEDGATPEELEREICDRTAAVYYFYNPDRMEGQVPLELAIDMCRSRDLPLIVDAAAQLPPVENLWRFTEMGVTATLFSGGKGLCGPQSSGLVLGKKALIDACSFNACPRAFIGRPMKAGKEEIVGLLAAVRRYVSLDHGALMNSYEEQVRYVIERLSPFGTLSVTRSFPSEAGQPMPRAEIILDEAALRISRDELLSRLRQGSPSVALAPSGDHGVFINPQTLGNGEEKIVVDRIISALADA